MATVFPHLREANAIRGRKLRNRIVWLPTANQLSAHGIPTDASIAWYGARARGVGMVISEPVRVHPTDAPPQSIVAYERGAMEGMARIGEVVHTGGALLVGHLIHGGRQHHSRSPRLLWAPSAVPCPFSGYVPHEMTPAEIDELQEHFVRAAAICQAAGWDGIELHASHGHLLQQFLSPLSNVREDRYGGDFERRLTFVRECLEGIRRRCGDAFIVGIRLAATEFLAGGIDLGLSREIAHTLEVTKLVDYFSVSQSNFSRIDAHVPDRHTPPHPFVENAAEIRKSLKNTPVVASGRIRTPNEAEDLLAKGYADLVGIARPLIADADWAVKALSGRADEIRPCIYCNVCWQGVDEKSAISCAVNPSAGRESRRPYQTSERSRNVIVVGGGPAGMTAAAAAARRGHHVTLFEARDRLGGQIAVAAELSGEDEYSTLVDYLERNLGRTGVEVHLETHLDAEHVRELAADLVILATGSSPDRAAFPPVEPIPAFSAVEAWMVMKLEAQSMQHVALLDEDGHFTTAATADLLLRNGCRVSLITRHLNVGNGIPLVSLTTLIGRLHEAGAEFYPGYRVSRSAGTSLILEHVYSHRETSLPNVDSLVVCGAQRVEDGIYRDLLATGSSVKVIGDAVAPRALKDAVYEGDLAGRTV